MPPVDHTCHERHRGRQALRPAPPGLRCYPRDVQDLALADLKAQSVLVVGAHPDDAEFSAGGTLALLADAGARVSLVVCTDGARGGRGVENVAAVRAEEQGRAAVVLGIERALNLGRPDGELVCDSALVVELVRAIRRDRPDLVLTHDPETRFRRFGRRTFLGHSDHRATGQAVLDALYPRAGNPNFFPEQLSQEGLEPWMPGWLFLFDSARTEERVAIGAALERKLEALRCHASQAHSGGGLIEAARGAAQRVGSPDNPAEAFLRLKISG